MSEESATKRTQQGGINMQAELDLVRDTIRSGRPRVRKSTLDPYRWQLLELHGAGATLKEMVGWLRHRTGRKFARSTVCRFLQRCLGGRNG